MRVVWRRRDKELIRCVDVGRGSRRSVRALAGCGPSLKPYRFFFEFPAACTSVHLLRNTYYWYVDRDHPVVNFRLDSRSLSPSLFCNLFVEAVRRGAFSASAATAARAVVSASVEHPGLCGLASPSQDGPLPVWSAQAGTVLQFLRRGQRQSTLALRRAGVRGSRK